MPEPIAPVVENVPPKHAHRAAVLGSGNTEAQPLPVYISATDDGATMFTSRWRLSEAERKRVAETGDLWLCVINSYQPPINLLTICSVNEAGEICSNDEHIMRDPLEKLADRGSVQTALPSARAFLMELRGEDIRAGKTPRFSGDEYERVIAFADAFYASHAPTPLSAEELAPLLHKNGHGLLDSITMAKSVCSLPGVAVVRGKP